VQGEDVKKLDVFANEQSSRHFLSAVNVARSPPKKMKRSFRCQLKFQKCQVCLWRWIAG